MKWQPIETAPKDGTRVDLWHPVYERTPDAWWDNRRSAWVYWGYTGFGSMSDIQVEGAPTHWMPLPPAPEADDAE